jgi:hypothetical protein
VRAQSFQPRRKLSTAQRTWLNAGRFIPTSGPGAGKVLPNYLRSLH